MPRKNSTEIQHPLTTYAPWNHHELVHRSNSIGSVQQTPTQLQSQYQAKEKQKLEHNANKQRVLKEGYTTSYSTDDVLSVSTQASRIKQSLEITSKRKSEDYAHSRALQLMSPSVLETLKREQPHSLREGLGPQTSEEATYQKRDQNPERGEDQLPHPLKCHPQAQAQTPPPSQTKPSIQNLKLVLPLVEQRHPKLGMQYPSIYTRA